MISGKWSQAAANEAKKFHNINIVNDTDNLQENLLAPETWKVDPKAEYFGFCQNESIDGVEFDAKLQRSIIDRVKAENPNAIIVADMSSAIGSVRLKDLWQDYGVVYAGAQKNFGTSGLTFTIVRDDVLDRVRHNQTPSMPAMMDWTK